MSRGDSVLSCPSEATGQRTNKQTNKMHTFKFTNKSTGHTITINAHSFKFAYIDFLWTIANPSDCYWPDDYTVTSNEF